MINDTCRLGGFLMAAGPRMSDKVKILVFESLSTIILYTLYSGEDVRYHQKSKLLLASCLMSSSMPSGKIGCPSSPMT